VQVGQVHPEGHHHALRRDRTVVRDRAQAGRRGCLRAGRLDAGIPVPRRHLRHGARVRLQVRDQVQERARLHRGGVLGLG
jgi:hypothetical protein